MGLVVAVPITVLITVSLVVVVPITVVLTVPHTPAVTELAAEMRCQTNVPLRIGWGVFSCCQVASTQTRFETLAAACCPTAAVCALVPRVLQVPPLSVTLLTLSAQLLVLSASLVGAVASLVSTDILPATCFISVLLVLYPPHLDVVFSLSAGLPDPTTQFHPSAHCPRLAVVVAAIITLSPSHCRGCCHHHCSSHCCCHHHCPRLTSVVAATSILQGPT